MPNQDGTGPNGTGRPGRGFGPCGRFGREFIKPGRCFGRGFRFRGGSAVRGRRSWINEPTSSSQDIYPYNRQELEAQRKELESQLAWLNDQLNSSKDE